MFLVQPIPSFPPLRVPGLSQWNWWYFQLQMGCAESLGTSYLPRLVFLSAKINLHGVNFSINSFFNKLNWFDSATIQKRFYLLEVLDGVKGAAQIGFEAQTSVSQSSKNPDTGLFAVAVVP